MRKMLFVLFKVILLVIGFCIAAPGQEKPEKQFKIFCGDVSMRFGVMEFSDDIYGLYDEAYDPVPFEETRHFACGLLVPVWIANRGSSPVTIAGETASWTDFVSVQTSRVALLDFDEEFDGLTCALGMSLVKLLELYESRESRLIATAGARKKVLQGGESELAYFSVTFHNPEKMAEGTYVFLPRVDFSGLSAVLADLSRGNHDGELKFEDKDFGNECLDHHRLDLQSTRGKRSAICQYILQAVELFRLQQAHEAGNRIDKAFSVNPDCAPALLTLAGFRYAANDYEKAHTYLSRAQSLLEQGSDPFATPKELSFLLRETYEWTAFAYHELRQFEEAERYYLLAIEMFNDKAFDPGPAISDSWGMECGKLYGRLREARMGIPPYGEE